MSREKTARPARPIDWATIRERLDQASHAEFDSAQSSDREANVLQRRADAARASTRHHEAPIAGTPIITFRIGEQVLALEAATVTEAHVLAHEVEALPGLPVTVRGLANVRSRVLAVFDVTPLLQLPAPPSAEGRRILIVNAEQAEFALLIDEVLDPRTISAVVAHRDVTGLNPQFVQSLTPDGVVLLDLPELVRALVISDSTSHPFPASNS